MQMDIGMDTGPVYVKRALSIRPDETAATLHDRLAELGATTLAECLAGILNGQLVATAQDESATTYAPLIKKEDGRLDWQQRSPLLERQVRGMTPWPGAFTTWDGENLKIRSAQRANGPLPSGAPGQVVRVRDGIAVLTPEGGLELGQIQLAGKRAMAAVDFVRGHPDFVDSILGE
jgi:methionyl-tRNA formyltransferase